MATLMHTNKYTATLSGPVVTTEKSEGLNFMVSTDSASYTPEEKGKIKVDIEGGLKPGPRLKCSVTADEGLEITSKDGEQLFQVKKDVTKGEILAHVKIAYEDGKVKVDLDIPCVVVIAAKK